MKLPGFHECIFAKKRYIQRQFRKTRMSSFVYGNVFLAVRSSYVDGVNVLFKRKNFIATQ